ncbi:MAG: phosphoribosylformylglycinamidine cyclo-ligase [Candidatus Zixiibacteriota bacterium]
MTKNKPGKKLSYAEAGVDIAAGEEAVQRIKLLARKTFNENVLSEIGSFGGFFKPPLEDYKTPVIISSADGVGTKLKLAFLTGKHDTVGEDLVNHCINDILVHGAKALFFMDYIATGKLKPEIIAEIVAGLSRGCANAGVALLGGETAEMPDFYQPGEYDLAGFIVGLVDQNRVINGVTIREGDICLGLASNGLHTNGYTLARMAALDIAGLKPDDYVKELKMTVSEALMRVHRCYAPVIHPLLEKYDIHGMAHITGGGIAGNLCRIIPDGLSAEVRKDTWPITPVFTWLENAGNIDPNDMFNTFNMGIGYILVVSHDEADNIVESLEQSGEKTFRIGTIKTGQKKVRLV